MYSGIFALSDGIMRRNVPEGVVHRMQTTSPEVGNQRKDIALE